LPGQVLFQTLTLKTFAQCAINQNFNLRDAISAFGFDLDRWHGFSAENLAHPMIAGSDLENDFGRCSKCTAGLHGAEDAFACGLIGPDASEAGAGGEMIAAGDDAEVVTTHEAFLGIGFLDVVAH